MAWTYTSDPEDVDRDAVRLLIGDTDTTDQQLQDAELDWFLSDEGSVSGAAIAAARAIQARYARMVDKAVGDLRLSYSQRADHYADLATRLERRRAQRTGVPFAGGISQAQKDTVEADTDRVEPYFTRGQFRDIDEGDLT